MIKKTPQKSKDERKTKKAKETLTQNTWSLEGRGKGGEKKVWCFLCCVFGTVGKVQF